MEEILKEIMGNSYKEGLTKDDITSYFEKSVISSGKVVPIEKYTNVEKNYKDSKSTVQDLTKKIEELNNSNLSAEDLKAKLEKEQQEKIDALTKEVIKGKVEKVFAENGILEDDYKGVLDSIVGLNEETSLNTANSIVSMLTKQSDAKSKALLEQELNKGSKIPTSGVGTSNVDTRTDAQKYVSSFFDKSNADNWSNRAQEMYFNKN